MEPENTPELTSYRANCHCGAVTLTLRIPSLKDHEVSCCNCSICMRNGYLMVYPKRENVALHSGYDHLKSYRFASKRFEHKFCSTCGSSVLGDGHYDILAVNVRMFKDVDLKSLKYKYVDGKTREEEYKVPETLDTSMLLPKTSALTRYCANCQCGAVTCTFLIPSLADLEVIDCDCSICTHNGYLLVYPDRKEVVFHTGYDHLHSYAFGDKKMTHKFCPTCGSSLMIDFHGGPTIVEGGDRLGINVRMLQDIKPQELNRRVVEMKNEGIEYTVAN